VKLKLDENLPLSVSIRLAAIGFDTDTVLAEGLLLVRLPDTEQWRIGDYLLGWFSAPDARTWERCFVVATLNKVRVLRPPSPTGP